MRRVSTSSVVVLAFCVLLVAILVNDHLKEDTHYYYPGYNIVGTVPRINWRNTNNFIQEVVSLYRENLPYGNLSYFPFIPPSKKIEMTLETLWEQIQEGSHVLYSSGNIELYKALEAELPSLDWLVVDRSEPITVMLWMGSKGVTTPTHYDKSHNFFVQIYEKKRFILSPPSEHKKLHIYPSLHPMRLQSQVDFGNIHTEKFTKFDLIWAEEALLGPGDILYLPPYWFHRVITEEPGINVWSSSQGSLIEEETKHIPIPISQTWSHSEIVLGLKIYFLTLVKKLTSSSEEFSRRFLQDMTSLQFVPLFSETVVPHSVQCQFSKLESDLFLEKWKNRFEEGISLLVPLFRSLEDEYVRELEVFTFVEKLTAVCLGPENVYPFLRECFLDNKN